MKLKTTKYKIFLLTLIASVIINVNSELRAETTESSVKISFDQNPIFGFAPSIELNYPITNNIDFVPYVQYWGNLADNDTIGYTYPGMEFGLGLNFKLIDQNLNILTSLGIFSGNSYSGGGRFVIFDAIVPIIKANYKINDKLSADIFARAWLQGRTVSNRRYAFDDGEINVFLNYKINQKFDLGFFYFQYLVNKKNQIENTSNFYTGTVAIGPTFTFNSKNLKLMVGYGVDIVDYLYTNIDDENKVLKDFYTIKANFNL
ncbi:MAG: hypothetical protein A2X64_06080 [Ignavibacteria bacterium GWF2_33_9]|nr:MAG: hypothetical protein A2X64_06080 [Ignavibacteria bacterium GWF2_33_9]